MGQGGMLYNKALNRSVLTARVGQSPDGRDLPLYPALVFTTLTFSHASVNADDYEVPGSASVLFACVFAGFADLFIFDWFCVCAV